MKSATRRSLGDIDHWDLKSIPRDAMARQLDSTCRFPADLQSLVRRSARRAEPKRPTVGRRPQTHAVIKGSLEDRQAHPSAADEEDLAGRVSAERQAHAHFREPIEKVVRALYVKPGLRRRGWRAVVVHCRNRPLLWVEVKPNQMCVLGT